MSLLRDLLRRLRGEPPPPVGAAPPTPPRESAESPYRRPAEVPARAWPGPLDSLEGYEIVGTLESDGELYARHLVVSPAAPERRASVACFGTRGLDDQLFLVLVDEVRALKRLDHPRIARLLDLGHEREVVWVLSEYPRGDTLESLVARIAAGAAPPSIDVAMAAFADFAEGLDAAHRERLDDGRPLGLRYPHLGPSSLLFGSEGPCQIVDWGVVELARAHRSLRDSGAPSAVLLLPELRFMAPEIVTGKVVEARADVFALGVMLHELTTGSTLFRANTDLGILENILKQEPLPPTRMVRGYPDELSRLVMRSLAKSTEARLTAGELAAGLRTLLHARGVEDPSARVAAYLRQAG